MDPGNGVWARSREAKLPASLLRFALRERNLERCGAKAHAHAPAPHRAPRSLPVGRVWGGAHLLSRGSSRRRMLRGRCRACLWRPASWTMPCSWPLCSSLRDLLAHGAQPRSTWVCVAAHVLLASRHTFPSSLTSIRHPPPPHRHLPRPPLSFPSLINLCSRPARGSSSAAAPRLAPRP